MRAKFENEFAQKCGKKFEENLAKELEQWPSHTTQTHIIEGEI